MTPTLIETYARSKYNATGDTFFTEAEIFYYIYQAQLELASETDLYESPVATINMVAGTRSYDYPDTAKILKRLEYNVSGGTTIKLQPITFREDDALTLQNSTSTVQGTPQFYTIFNEKIYLRPTPASSVDTITVYFYGEPAVVTTMTTLETPTLFHMDLVDFVVREMYAKDKDLEMTEYFDQRWEKSKSRIKRWVQKRKRGDSFTVVQNEDNLAVTITGPV